MKHATGMKNCTKIYFLDSSDKGVAQEGGRSADKKLKIEHPIIFKILYNGNDDKNGRQDDGVDDSKEIDDDNNDDDDDDDDNAMMKYGFALGYQRSSRAKRASGAPWVRKFGKQSIR